MSNIIKYPLVWSIWWICNQEGQITLVPNKLVPQTPVRASQHCPQIPLSLSKTIALSCTSIVNYTNIQAYNDRKTSNDHSNLHQPARNPHTGSTWQLHGSQLNFCYLFFLWNPTQDDFSAIICTPHLLAWQTKSRVHYVYECQGRDSEILNHHLPPT